MEKESAENTWMKCLTSRNKWPLVTVVADPPIARVIGRGHPVQRKTTRSRLSGCVAISASGLCTHTVMKSTIALIDIEATLGVPVLFEFAQGFTFAGFGGRWSVKVVVQMVFCMRWFNLFNLFTSFKIMSGGNV